MLNKLSSLGSLCCLWDAELPHRDIDLTAELRDKSVTLTEAVQQVRWLKEQLEDQLSISSFR